MFLFQATHRIINTCLLNSPLPQAPSPTTPQEPSPIIPQSPSPTTPQAPSPTTPKAPRRRTTPPSPTAQKLGKQLTRTLAEQKQQHPGVEPHWRPTLYTILGAEHAQQAAVNRRLAPASFREYLAQDSAKHGVRLHSEQLEGKPAGRRLGRAIGHAKVWRREELKRDGRALLHGQSGLRVVEAAVEEGEEAVEMIMVAKCKTKSGKKKVVMNCQIRNSLGEEYIESSTRQKQPCRCGVDLEAIKNEHNRVQHINFCWTRFAKESDARKLSKKTRRKFELGDMTKARHDRTSNDDYILFAIIEGEYDPDSVEAPRRAESAPSVQPAPSRPVAPDPLTEEEEGKRDQAPEGPPSTLSQPPPVESAPPVEASPPSPPPPESSPSAPSEVPPGSLCPHCQTDLQALRAESREIHALLCPLNSLPLCCPGCGVALRQDDSAAARHVVHCVRQGKRARGVEAAGRVKRTKVVVGEVRHFGMRHGGILMPGEGLPRRAPLERRSQVNGKGRPLINYDRLLRWVSTEGDGSEGVK
ncbi:hypothetical protein BU24DRAFT_473267 [Aaosphaeria arxii CBS 175.79]|uniref:Uncharacterized protein n=1 Tax=Aaosphaeria arxii CBS 175.79 TaxID=1450172 RepID=A0A6A5XB05_9PLEO|nr:uncharacterized protein BU24DRAFT_473267 [Aaosphaeria arxii CBS 175.79]KAF2010090.1 hypothetical protein BU24DRAFT_473267 [Aaosphaeria arxii CBS 175.79]